MADFQDALVVACAEILTGKGGIGLIERVDICVDKVLHTAGSGTACHQNGVVKRVDGGLDGDVGQREQHALQTGGDAYLHDLLELHAVDLQLFQIQPQRAGFLHQTPNDQRGGNALGDHGGQCHTGHVHVELDDKNQVQQHIDHTGGQQEIQRTLRIPAGTEQGCAEVIKHGGGHTGKIDPQIDRGQPQHIVGALHPLQNHAGTADTYHRQKKTTANRQENGGVDGFAEFFILMRAVMPRGQNVCADGKPQKQVGQQVDEGRVGSHRSQRVISGIPAHHNDIRRVEQQLQHRGERKRNGEPQYLWKNRAVQHIDLITFP